MSGSEAQGAFHLRSSEVVAVWSAADRPLGHRVCDSVAVRSRTSSDRDPLSSTASKASERLVEALFIKVLKLQHGNPAVVRRMN